MNKKIVTLIISLVFSLAFSANIEVESLSLDDYLEQVLMTHPTIKKNISQYYSQLKSIETIDAIDDWNLFLSTSYTKGYAVQGSTLYSDKANILQLNGGAKGLLKDTGTRLQISSSTSFMRDIPNFLGTNSNLYSLDLNLSVSQPILRNAFGEMDRFPLRLAKYNKELIQIKYLQDLEDFLKTLVDEYLDWQLAYKTMLINREQYKKANVQLASVTEQYKKGAAEKKDLVQVKQNVTSKRIQYLSSQKELEIKNQVIMSRTGLSIEDLLNVVPSEQFIFDNPLNEQYALSYFQNESNYIKLLSINESIQLEQIDYQKDLLKPVGEIFFSQTLGSSEDNSNSMIEKFGKQKPYTLGIKFETALDNTFAKKELESGKYLLEKILNEKQDLLSMGIDAIKAVYKNLEYLDKMIQESTDLVELSKEYASLEENRFKQGRSSLFFLLTAQDQYLGTQLQLEVLKITKMKLINQLSSHLDVYQKSYIAQKVINNTFGGK
jgi:outer membrane protein TolC